MTSKMKRNENLKTYFQYAELSGAYIIAFTLPVLESVKWWGSALFILGTAGRFILKTRIKWRKPNAFEWILIAFFGIALLSTIVNWPIPKGLAGLKETFVFVLLGWLMSLNDFSEDQMLYFIYALIGGILFGLSLSSYDLFSGRNPFLVFKSIPNLNRSVIYNLLVIFTMIGILMDTSGRFSRKARTGVGICLTISLAGLVTMGSRAGIITFFTGTGLLFGAFIGNRRVMSILAIGFATLVVSFIIISNCLNIPTVKSRIDRLFFYYSIVKNEPDALPPITGSDRVRSDYMRVAWAQITQKNNLLLGSGPETFGDIKVESLTFDPPLLEYKTNWDVPAHAHNEYLNIWVEQGLMGLAVHIIFLFYLGRSLLRNRSSKGRVYWQWIAGVGIFNTTAVAGLFNTVLANEIAWLVMMLAGMYMRWIKCRQDRVESTDFG